MISRHPPQRRLSSLRESALSNIAPTTARFMPLWGGPMKATHVTVNDKPVLDDQGQFIQPSDMQPGDEIVHDGQNYRLRKKAR